MRQKAQFPHPFYTLIKYRVGATTRRGPMRHAQRLAIHLPGQEDALMDTDGQRQGRIMLARGIGNTLHKPGLAVGCTSAASVANATPRQRHARRDQRVTQ